MNLHKNLSKCSKTTTKQNKKDERNKNNENKNGLSEGYFMIKCAQ